MGGAIASPSTAYVYDWNILPIGQQLWLKHLETYIDFPPLQDPASYNLEQVMQQVKSMKTGSRLTRAKRTACCRAPHRGAPASTYPRRDRPTATSEIVAAVKKQIAEGLQPGD